MKMVRILVFWTLLPTGLLAEQITRDYDRAVDFKQYKTFAWVNSDKLSIFTADESAAQEVNLIELDRQIRGLIEKELEKKGFQKVSGEPDLLVNYVAIGKVDLTLTEYSTSPLSSQITYGHWRAFYNVNKDMRLQRKGTLTIDLVDRSTDKLVWRATASDTFSKPKDGAKKATKVVKKMFKKFPK